VTANLFEMELQLEALQPDLNFITVTYRSIHAIVLSAKS
jgi:hypothetical protein